MTGSAETTKGAGAPAVPSRLARSVGAVLHFVRTQGQSPSTWRGLALLASACGIVIRPDLMAAITAVGMAVSGLIGVLAGPDAPAE
jgi:hypothetical protein